MTNRRNSNLGCRASLIAAILCLAAVRTASSQSPPYSMSNQYVKVTFGTAPAYELASIQSLNPSRPAINLLNSATLGAGKYSGAWSVLLRDRVDPKNVPQGWFNQTAGGGLYNVSASTPPPVTAPNGDQTFTVTFTANLDFDGRTGVSMTTIVLWKLYNNANSVQGKIYVTINDHGTPLNQLPFYVSQVKFPSLFMDYVGSSLDTHQLVIPFAGGLLMQDPILSTYWPSLSGPSDTVKADHLWAAFMTPPLLAYYDDVSKDCLYFTDDDLWGYYRDFEFERIQNTSVPPQTIGIELRARHLPDDLYNRTGYVTPYGVRISAMVGDWVDVAKRYRSFLADPSNYSPTNPLGPTNFYFGPVGSSQNPMSTEFKNLVLQNHLEPWFVDGSDVLDEFARDSLNSRRLGLGAGELTIWSAGFYPDVFDAMFYDGFDASWFLGKSGYLPGRPSYVAAVTETQRPSGGPLVAPFFSSWGGIDPTNTIPPLRTTPMSGVIANDGVYHEDFDQHRGPPQPNTYPPYATIGECNGQYPASSSSATTWSDVFKSYVTDFLTTTGAKGLYCDAFGSNVFPCYASTSQHPNHKPGGGYYMFAGRNKQIADLKAAVPTLRGVTMEGAHLWFIGEVDLMHATPMRSAIDEVDPNNVSYFVPSAKTIPFFRMVADSVKMTTLIGNGDFQDNGRHCWLNAMDVFAFGFIPHVGNQYAEGTKPIYGDESQRDQAPYERYMRHMIQFLRDTMPAPSVAPPFLRFHNGTLDRTPPFTVSGPPTPNLRLGCGSSTALGQFNDPWIDQYLVLGMYKAPPTGGTTDFALVVTNPWVDVAAPSWQLSTTFDPTVYIPNYSGTYTYVAYANDGTVASSGSTSGVFSINQAVTPGDVLYWVFSL